MIAVILSGLGGTGEGASLHGEYVPKPLLPAGPGLLLEGQLKRLKETAIDDVILCLGYGADKVRQAFGDGSRCGVKLRYSVEEGVLGSAGTLKALGPASLPEDILVLSGDAVPGPELEGLLRAHAAHDGAATLAVKRAVGHEALVVVGPRGTIVDFPPAPVAGHDAFEVEPLWAIRRRLLHYVPEAGASDFVKDVFPAAMKAGESLVAYVAPAAKKARKR